MMAISRIRMNLSTIRLFHSHRGRGKEVDNRLLDDATRIRVLRIYECHNQINTIDLINYVVEKFPFRIKTIRTDNGHEFQSKFNWYVHDLGMDHVYIKPGTPQLNGKIEHPHLTDKQEFYQLIDYVDDVDLREKLAKWAIFYNCHRPYSAHCE